MSYSSVFPNAKDARNLSRNIQLINTEVNKIEDSVLESMAQGNYSVIVNDSFMTEPLTSAAQDYYSSWKGNTPSVVLNDQMNQVELYFSNKGYTINRRTNTNTQNTFEWVLRW